MTGLIDRARIYPRGDWRKTWLIRSERIKREGSGYFNWDISALAATASEHIEIASEFPRAKKYEPLDWCEVVNNDTVDITITLNNNDTLIVPGKTIRTIDNAAIWEATITNQDAAVAVTLGLIQVTFRRQALTIDEWARRGA